MSQTDDINASTHAEDEAVAWLVRLRAPGGPRRQEAFEDWYAACPANAAAFERVLASWDDLENARETPLGTERHRVPAAVARSRARRIAVAAVAVVAASALIVVGGRPFGLGPQTLIPVAYASAVGEIRTVALPDGSVVTLDTDTAVRAAYSGTVRQVRLVRGRARFKVAHDRRPFIVDADDHTVTATGTTFDVDLRDDRLAVTTLDGQVGVARVSGDAAQPVASGQALVFASAASPGQAQTIPATEMTWPSGMLSFENAGLKDVVEQANRYSRTKIILADNVEKLRFTGTVRVSATGELARMLAAMFELKEVRGADGIILEPAGR